MRNFLVLLAVIALTGCHEEPKAVEPVTPKVEGDKITFETNAPQLTSLDSKPAENRTNAISHLTGRLYWNDDATVRIFTPVAGRVVAVRARLGDAISVGTPLAEIDSPDFGQALANARSATGNLAAAKKSYERSKELLQHGAAAQKDLEAAEAAYVAAQAERDRAQAVLANYGGSDKETNSIYILRSPLAGELVEKNINPGQEVRADQMLANATQLFAPLFVVSDPTKLWLQLDVPDSELSALQPGQALRIAAAAFPDKSFDGVVDNIGAELDPTTRTIKVRGVVNNPDEVLKAEMYVMADVVMSAAPAEKTAVEVPAKAVFMQNNQYYVFIENGVGQFQRQLVKVGPEQDGRIPVYEGVQAGQKVVTEGCLLLESLLESTDKS